MRNLTPCVLQGVKFRIDRSATFQHLTYYNILGLIN